MKLKLLSLTSGALHAAVLLIITSCSSTPPPSTIETSSSSSYQEGVPGGVVTQTHKLTANVTEIDVVNRRVMLLGPNNTLTIVKCGPEVSFDQFRVGDRIKATLTEELAVSMAPGATSAGDGAASVVDQAPQGGKLRTVVADTVQLTARVTALDRKHHKATLQFPDGSTRTFAVRPDVDLTQRKVGEKVVIRTTEVVAVSVERP